MIVVIALRVHIKYMHTFIPGELFFYVVKGFIKLREGDRQQLVFIIFLFYVPE